MTNIQVPLTFSNALHLPTCDTSNNEKRLMIKRMRQPYRCNFIKEIHFQSWVVNQLALEIVLIFEFKRLG